MTPVLRALSLSKSYEHPVLTDLSFAVDPGHRIGVVGENGSGKSTLLRLLAGIADPDDGTVERPDDLGYLHQELAIPRNATVQDVVDAALAEVRAVGVALEAAATAVADERPGAEAAYDAALARAHLAEVWDADARAARTLAGLGLDAARTATRRVDDLSGGERTRLGLAALLVRQPGALLLDEPTNHLDGDAADFLVARLRAIPGAVVLASHDRVFLDEVCTEILDLDPQAPVLYGGAYRDYLDAKRVERERWEQRYAAEQDELRALRRSVAGTARRVAHDRPARDNAKMLYDFKAGRVQSQVSRRVRNAQQRLDTLEREQVRRPPRVLRFAPPPAVTRHTPQGGLLLWARDVVVPGRLDAPARGIGALDIAVGAKLLVTGINGSGKSTLLHVLAGDLVPGQGAAGKASGVSVGLLEQDLYLHEDTRTPRDLLALVQGEAVDAHGLLAPRDLGRPLSALSVGQRRRVVLAMLVAQAPDVLLLDEPTNHVSLTLAEDLMAAVAAWPGAVVVASHDRWLRRHWTGDVLHLG